MCSVIADCRYGSSAMAYTGHGVIQLSRMTSVLGLSADKGMLLCSDIAHAAVGLIIGLLGK